MKKFEVSVFENINNIFTVEASDAEEAQRIALKKYLNEEYDANNITSSVYSMQVRLKEDGSKDNDDTYILNPTHC